MPSGTTTLSTLEAERQSLRRMRSCSWKWLKEWVFVFRLIMTPLHNLAGKQRRFFLLWQHLWWIRLIGLKEPVRWWRGGRRDCGDLCCSLFTPQSSHACGVSRETWASCERLKVPLQDWGFIDVCIFKGSQQKTLNQRDSEGLIYGWRLGSSIRTLWNCYDQKEILTLSLSERRAADLREVLSEQTSFWSPLETVCRQPLLSGDTHTV